MRNNKIKLPGGRRVTIWTSSKPSRGRKAWTGLFQVKGKPGSAKRRAKPESTGLVGRFRPGGKEE